MIGGGGGAADLAQCVEDVGGLGEAGEVKLQRVVWYKVSAAQTGYVEVGFKCVDAYGAVQRGGKREVSAEAGVLAQQHPGDCAQGSGGPGGCEVKRNVFQFAGFAECAFKVDEAGVCGGGVGAGGMGFQADMPFFGLGQPEGQGGVGEREGHLHLVVPGAHFEVDAGSGGLYVREAGDIAEGVLCGGGDLHAGGLEEDALEVPAAVWQVDEVDAGVKEGDAGELDVAPPEGGEAEAGADLVGADDRLIAKGGVFIDDEIFNGEAGRGEHGEGDGVEVDGAAERGGDAGGDLAAEAIHADERRQHGEQNQREEDGEDDEDAPAGRRLEWPGLEVLGVKVFLGHWGNDNADGLNFPEPVFQVMVRRCTAKPTIDQGCVDSNPQRD